MPHSCPDWTSGTSSLNLLRVFNVPSWITISSRSKRTPALLLATPSVTKQPATFPTPDTLNTSLIWNNQ